MQVGGRKQGSLSGILCAGLVCLAGVWWGSGFSVRLGDVLTWHLEQEWLWGRGNQTDWPACCVLDLHLVILCLPGALTSVYARARLRSAHLRRSGRGVRVEGLQAGLLCHPHPIRLAAQARQIIFVPSDSARAFAPLHGLFSYQCRFSISRARQAHPARLPPHQALVGISLPSSSCWGWCLGPCPRSGSPSLHLREG